MRSTFLGFNTVKLGLFAAQRALDITGHNIANVNTKGYTRQRLNQVASTPMSLYGGRGMLGTGVDSLSITQLRNEFLDFKYRTEINALGYWETRRDALQFIEAIFNEPSDTSVGTVIDEFFSAFHELNKNPESLTVRALVRQRGVAFAHTMRHMYHQLEKFAIDMNFEIITTVTSINGYAEEIARLNNQIYRAELDGGNANDLRDQRNVLIDELSKLVNVEVVEVVDVNDDIIKGQENNKTNKKLVLQINGQPLVYHDRAYKLDVSEEINSVFDDGVKMREIRWETGIRLNTSGLQGQLKSLLDLRDGVGGETKGIPYYLIKLNEFVAKFAEEINQLHFDGYGLNGVNGYYFFTPGGVDSTTYDPLNDKITAKNIHISFDIDTDLNKIAASESIDLLPGDGSIALRISELRHDLSMFQEGKPEDFMKSLISNLGVDTQEAIRMAFNQQFLTEQLDNQRQSISGVSMDEEMANMIRFQHAYNASARMITTMDEAIDIIINRMGLVGR